MKNKTGKPTAILYILLLLLSLIPFSSSVSALVWNPGVTYSCDNEYYNAVTTLTLDNISVSTHWCSFNGIGFNLSFTGTRIYVNISSIASSPKSSTGWIMNWSSQKTSTVPDAHYWICGLKPLHDYILYGNLSLGGPTTSTKTSKANGSFQINQTQWIRTYKIYDVGIPNTWYVSLTTNVPAGSDVTGTGSIVAPFATIRKAINASTTSDTIIIRGGNYQYPGWGSVGYMRINRSGTKTAPYTITNYTGEEVVIDGQLRSMAANYGMFMLYGALVADNATCYTNITIHGINFSNCSKAAIRGYAHLTTASNDIIIEDCSFYNISLQAIYMYNEHSDVKYIQNITIRNCSFQRTEEDYVAGETVSLSGCKNFVFSNNTIGYHRGIFFDPGNGGMNGLIEHNVWRMNASGACIKIDGASYGTKNITNVTIRNNLFYGVMSVGTTKSGCVYLMNEIAGGSLFRIYVYNNVINMTLSAAGDYGHGIQIKGVAGATINKIEIKHNTIYIYDGASSRNIYLNENGGTFKDIVIANNILLNGGTAVNLVYSGDIASTETTVFNRYNNLYDSIDATTWASTFSDGNHTEATCVVANPLCVGVSAGDFHLNITSPAIGAATAVYGVPLDYDGTVRPQALTYDIGAYERIGAGVIPAAPTATTPGPTSNAVDRTSPIPALNITAEDLNADSMDLYFRSNHTGAWVTLSSNLAVFNGTYQSLLPGFVSPGKKWWSVNLTDGAYWTNKTFNFTFIVVAPPTSGITLSNVRANWTTSTTINLTWTKGANCTNTYVYRSTMGYTLGTVLLYSGTNSYYNNTLLDPTVRYYYTLRPYNSVSLLFGNYHNVSLAETNNATSYGASWLKFPGFIATDKSLKTNFHYATTPAFTITTVNLTVNETGYNTGADNSFDANYWNEYGQVFKTGGTRYYIYNASFYLSRDPTLTPGLIYCQILEVKNGSYTPFGTVANSSGSRNGNAIGSSGEWFNITMSSCYLKSNTYYAVYVSCAGSGVNHIHVIADFTSPSYADGWVVSHPGGGPWTNDSTKDCLFDVWGKHPTIYGYGLITENETVLSSQLVNITQSGLSSGQMYWYYSTANDTKGNMTKGNTRNTLTNPGIPIFLNIIPYFANNSVKITWLKGTGANNTVIVKSNTAYPTVVTDGVIVYNGTGTTSWTTNISFNTSYYFSLFSFTTWGVHSRWSSAVTIPWGGVTFIVYNESKPWQVINATITVTDSLGLYPVQFIGTYGYYSINTSQIPYGENTLFYVSNVSYYSRLYPITIIPNIFYNFSFYLPPIISGLTTPGNVSYSYRIQIIDERVLPVQGALVKIYRYFNTTANYTYIGGFVSDGNGQGNIMLFPYVLYMIKVIKTGYQNLTDFWAPNIEEASTIKVFKIYFETETPTTTYLWNEQHVFTGGLTNNTGLLYLNYLDLLSQSNSWTMYIYYTDGGTEQLLATYTGTNNSFNISLIVTNTYDYHIVLWVDHTTFGIGFDELFIYGYHAHPTGKSTKFNVLMSLNFGWMPFGWSNFIVFFIALGVMFSFGRRETYMSVVLLGILLIFFDVYIGFPTIWNALASGVFPVIIIFLGILMLIRDRGMYGAS